MKDVKLKSLEMINFKGEKGRVTGFSPKETTLSGRNESGKSRHMDAFLWLLFGKDQLDRKDHEIYTKVDGQILEKVDATVKATLEVDGREINLSRTFRQNWVRPRGSDDQIYKGNETIYEVDDDPSIKAGEYKVIIDSIIEESVFKLLTSPSYFLNLKWQDQRDILFQIAGTISDAEVLERMATLNNKDAVNNLTNIINQGKNLSQFKKEILAKKSKLKKELDLIQPRIDQTIKLMPEAVNFEAFQKELESLDSQIHEIDTKLQNISDADKAMFAKNRLKQEEINTLKVKQQDFVLKAKEKAQEDVFNQNAKRRQIVEALTVANEGMAQFSAMETERIRKFKALSKEKKELEEKLEKLGVEWGEINERVFNENCPYCDQTLPDDSGREEFENHRKEELEKVNARGLKTQEEIERLDVAIEAVSTAGNKVVIQEKIDELNEKLKNTPHVTSIEVIKEELPEWQSLQAQIKIIEDSLIVASDTSELKTKKTELIAERDDIKTILNDKALIEKSKKEVVSLNLQAKSLASEIASLEKQEMQITEFTKIKITESENRINNLFKLVNFKLFDYTFEGNEFEVCIPTNKKGVPISTVNNAQQINAGLDIINVLCKFHNVTAPIFIDNREGVNDLVETQSQIINLVVTKEDFKVE